MSSVQSVINQNYTKFNVFFYNDGIPANDSTAIYNLFRESKFPLERLRFINNNSTKYPLFNIIRNAFESCAASQLQVVVDCDVEIIGPNYFQLINMVNYYSNQHAWMINSNFKTNSLKFGGSYSINNDY